MANFEDYVNEETLNKLRNKTSPKLSDVVLSPEEIETYSEPSIMDEYIKKTDPEQYSKIVRARAIKGAVESADGIGGPMGIMGTLGKEAIAAAKGGAATAKETIAAGKQSPGLGTLGEALSSKTKEGMQTVTNKAGAKKLVEEIKAGRRALSNEELNAIKEDPEFLKEFLKEMETQTPVSTKVSLPNKPPRSETGFLLGESKDLSEIIDPNLERTRMMLKKQGGVTVGTPYIPKSKFEQQVERLEPSMKMLEQTPDISKKLENLESSTMPKISKSPLRSESSVGLTPGKAIGLGVGGLATYGLLPEKQTENELSLRSDAFPLSEKELLDMGGYGSSSIPPKDTLAKILADTGAGQQTLKSSDVATSEPSTTSTPSADFDKEDSQYRQSLLEAFKQAQEEDKQRKAMAMLAMGASDMLRGGLGLSYKVKMPEAQNKLWEEQLKSNQAVQEFAARQEMEKEDPNSPISKRMKEIMRPVLAKLNISLPENISYSEMKENFPQYVKMYDTQIMQDQRKEEKELARQEKREREEKISDKQLTEVQDFERSIGEMSDALDLLGKNDNWVGMIDALEPKLIIGEDEANFRSALGRMADAYRKLITGAAAGDKELARLESRLPNLSDNPAQFKAKAKGFIEGIKKAKSRYLNVLEKSGKNVEAYKESPILAPSKESLSEEDKRAIDWAKKNPDNEYSKRILEMHGM